MSLRPYQDRAIVQIREQFSEGHRRVLLWLATGGGKTVIFCHMIKEARKQGLRAIVVVRGRKLVAQASKRLFREAVPHGVLMANHWNYRPHEAIQVCSIDTLVARGLMPEADLVIVDEGHLFSPDSKASELLDRYTCYVVPVTATPYVKKGLRHLADAIVHPVTMQDLIDEGHLVPFRPYVPTSPDLIGVRTDSKTGDYKTEQLEERMTANTLTGDIVESWKKLGEGRPTICFCVSIKHSKAMCEEFLAHGVKAEHHDADSTDAQRDAAISRLEKGETKLITNVGIFCTGVDIPPLGAIILARPTLSRNLYIQQAGRGTRTSDGKRDCILLDHAGNIERHGLPTMEPDVDLDGNVREQGEINVKICKDCFCAYRGKTCPECGKEPEEKPREIAHVDGELSEVIITAKDPMEQWLQYLQATRGGRSDGWVFKKMVEKFGPKCHHLLPEQFIVEQRRSAFNRSNFKGWAR